ncbi:unnamed protein product [Adineta steineri]|uniref:beta-N-acetylhexosaminidase n=1 Tax=Adineta steineri TaxID=433720 RepID=A0A818R4X6_9BILA|nr:unnamed protein product [Adineta steineri]CAF3651501.1 unnamed protein product [Adineta steineri]
MLSRRYLRRSLVTALLLPIVILLLLAIYQNRHVIFFETSFDHHDHGHHHEDHSDLSHDHIPNHKIRYQFSPKQLTTNSTTLLNVHINEDQQTKKSVQTSQIPSLMNVVNSNNNNKQIVSAKNQTLTLPVIETKNLQRFVHLDLKGAAPKVVYFEKLFPYLKQLGATGLLIEYEDMFPFTGRLSTIQHGLAYKKNDIEKILQLAEKNNLKVMPLLQVYGHLEYVLKLKEFMHLREDTKYPQVITPCLEESYELLFEMVDQMLTLHPSIPYLHIGCDEVYYRFIHPQCAKYKFRDEADLFIR